MTTDEIFANTPQTLMEKPTTDEEFLNIDWTTRLITIPSGLPNIGVFNDKDTNRIYFRCPVAYGEFKIADFGLRVNYLNTGASGMKYEGDVYFIDDVESDGEYLTFSWLVGRRAYLERGTTAFIVCCVVVDGDDNVVNELNTTVATLPVLEGLEVQPSTEEYPDYIEQLLKRVDEAMEKADSVKGDADAAAADAKEAQAAAQEALEAAEKAETAAENCITGIIVNGTNATVENNEVQLQINEPVYAWCDSDADAIGKHIEIAPLEADTVLAVRFTYGNTAETITIWGSVFSPIPVIGDARCGENSVAFFAYDAGENTFFVDAGLTRANLAITLADRSDYDSIARLVKNGLASQVFDIGDQINAKYTYNGTEYQWPFNVVDFRDVELEDGETVPGMILQAHYCTPYNMAFDAREAMYYAPDGLAAGTYNFTVGAHSWVSGDVGKTFQFTLKNAVPAGGLIVTANTYNVTFEGGTIAVYASGADTTALEEATMTEGSSGTSLGTINNADVSDTLNQCQRSLLGYNRWAQSGMRQWLNSKAAAGEWWESQNNFDMAPSGLASYAGFMSGFEDDFLNILKPTKVVTSLNTVITADGGGQDVTYDTFWPISLEQAMITPQISGVEGEAFEYWKRALGVSEPVGRNDVEGTWAVTYAVNAKTTAQIVRFRSAIRSGATTVWGARATGALSGSNASTASRVAPACVIC